MPSRRNKRKAKAVDVDDGDKGNNKKSKTDNADSDSANAPSLISHWLIKSEPETRIEKGVDVKFSLDDLRTEPDGTACWDGVRNYQARNNMNAMRVGHEAFFYHSNCKQPGIAGLVTVARESYPDHTQFDPKDPHYDPKSVKSAPRWTMVDVKYERELKRYISLKELKVGKAFVCICKQAVFT